MTITASLGWAFTLRSIKKRMRSRCSASACESSAKHSSSSSGSVTVVWNALSMVVRKGLRIHRSMLTLRSRVHEFFDPSMPLLRIVRARLEVREIGAAQGLRVS